MAHQEIDLKNPAQNRRNVFDHALARGEIPLPDLERAFVFFLWRKQRFGADFVQVIQGDVVEEFNSR